MRCVAIDSTGAVVDVTPQPASVADCTLVIASPAEVASSPFALDPSDAVLIGGACWALWATAWVARQVLDFLRSS